MKRVLRAQKDFQSTTLRNQLTSLIIYEAITTTRGNAKRLIAYANRFFNRIRLADLTAKKLAHQTLLDKNAVVKVFDEIMPRFQATEVNFLKTLRTAPRAGDSAEMMMVAILKPLTVTKEDAGPKDKNVKTASNTANKKKAVK